MAVLLATWSPAESHSVPDRFEPRRGAVLRTPPAEVRIFFEGDLEPAFSAIEVTDGAGRRLDFGESRVEGATRRALRVRLRPLGPGVYTVTWSVLAVDGHRTQGTYTFTVRPAP